MRGHLLTSRPLHVLLTTDVVGGVWDFCWVLASELIRSGHRVTLLAFGTPSPEHRRRAAIVGAALLDVPLKLEWMQDSADDVRRARVVTAKVVRDLKPDVVHVNQYALGRVETNVPVLLTAHSDVLSWCKWTERGGADGPIAIEWARYAALVRAGAEAADVVVAVSEFLAGELTALYAVDRDVEVVHNGWPDAVDDPPPITARDRVTLLAGRAWDSAKNLRLAAEAARGRPLGRVLLAGDQRNPESGRMTAFKRPIEPLGCLSREALDTLLRAARVYLAPARYEPFGLLPVQAALAGCPLLLTDIPSFRELWDGAALFFRRDDVADLRRQWALLLDNDGLAADLAGRAGRLARRRYAAERMATDYETIYARLLADRRARVADKVTGAGLRA